MGFFFLRKKITNMAQNKKEIEIIKKIKVRISMKAQAEMRKPTLLWQCWNFWDLVNKEKYLGQYLILKKSLSQERKIIFKTATIK